MRNSLNTLPLKHELPALEVKQLTGDEFFHHQKNNLPINILAFWRWSASNLAGNNLRGHLAEYLVASDFGRTQDTRIEWDSCDLRINSNIRVEVKSSAFLQSWQQKKLSSISFNIAPTFGWDSRSGNSSTECLRGSDVYIFCLLAHKEKTTLDPTNLDQWEFFVLPTSELDNKLGTQKTLSLSGLLKLAPINCKYGQIAKTVMSLLEKPN